MLLKGGHTEIDVQIAFKERLLLCTRSWAACSRMAIHPGLDRLSEMLVHHEMRENTEPMALEKRDDPDRPCEITLSKVTIAWHH